MARLGNNYVDVFTENNEFQVGTKTLDNEITSIGISSKSSNIYKMVDSHERKINTLETTSADYEERIEALENSSGGEWTYDSESETLTIETPSSSGWSYDSQTETLTIG